MAGGGDERTHALKLARGPVINVDNGAGTTIDFVLMRLSHAIRPVAARVVYTTETAGTIAAATVGLGTTVAGVDLVAATALENSKAIGTATALTLATTAQIPANTPIIGRHTGVATTAAGEYQLELEYYIDVY